MSIILCVLLLKNARGYAHGAPVYGLRLHRLIA